MKKFKVQSMLVLKYKKRNYKIFHSTSKQIARDSDIVEAFKSMHQSIMTKIKNFDSQAWVVESIVNRPGANLG